MIIINKNADYSSLGLGKAWVEIPENIKIAMQYYSSVTPKDANNLALFFDELGEETTSKISFMMLPLLASNTTEALYDVVSNVRKNPVEFNSSALVLDANHILQCDPSVGVNNTALFRNVFGDNTTAGTHVIMGIMPGTGKNSSFMGYTFGKTNTASGYVPAPPAVKFRGVGFAEVDGTMGKNRNYTDEGDSQHPSPVSLSSLTLDSYLFGVRSFAKVDGYGFRILCGAKDTSVAEDKKIRSAMLALDNKYFG